MHETMFINEISNALQQKLDKDAAFGRVVVNVRLSPFSNVAAESLQESFRELIKGKNCKNVPLNVLPLEIPVECRSCKRSPRVDELFEKSQKGFGKDGFVVISAKKR